MLIPKCRFMGYKIVIYVYLYMSCSKITFFTLFEKTLRHFNFQLYEYVKRFLKLIVVLGNNSIILEIYRDMIYSII